MKITTFTVQGPALDARVPLPRPVDTPTRPYPWNDFLSDMREMLRDYASAGMDDVESGDLARHLAPDGTCYWIRADLDSGPRFLRVYVAAYDDDSGEVDLRLETCDQRSVPGRLRLN
jgi:hypothetical protein